MSQWVRISLHDKVGIYPIEFYDADEIYISVAPGESSILIPTNQGYQVKEWYLPHQVDFFVPALTGNEFTDLLILEQLDDRSLGVIYFLDDYIKKLCDGDQLWINKLNSIGKERLTKVPSKLSFKDLWYSVTSSNLSNIALARNDELTVTSLIKTSQPNISNDDIKEIKELIPEGQPMTQLQRIRQQRLIEERERNERARAAGWVTIEYKPHHRRISENLIKFFQEAELGPQVNGQFVLRGNKWEIEPLTIQELPGTRLNDLLYFTQTHIRGQPNPLYGIIYDQLSGHTGPSNLFELHAFYRGLALPRNRMTSSPLMREYLGDTMRRILDNSVIHHDAQGRKWHATDDEYLKLLEDKAAQAKEAIDNPSLEINTHISGAIELFNPNNIDPYGNDQLIDTSVTETLSDDAVKELRQEVAKVYSLIPGITPENSLEKVYMINQRIIQLAKVNINMM